MSSPEVAAFVCKHVLKDTHPILLVSRADGDWQFLCGGTHANEHPEVVGVNHLFERDKTLLELIDLPNDWEAERGGLGQPWIRRKVEIEQ